MFTGSNILRFLYVFAVLYCSFFLVRTDALRGEDPRNNSLRINTICQEDTRLPTTGFPVGRVYFTEREEAICTAWLAPNGWFVTAGHCAAGYYRFDELQVNVPDSSCDGKISLPAKSDRYSIHSIKSRVNFSTHEDWALFRLAPNESGLPEFYHRGHFYRISNRIVSKKNSETLSNVGFGVDLRSSNNCRSRNRTLQQADASAYSTSGYLIHFVDTHMGNSGSPIFQEDQGKLYASGTHRGGGCPNIATSVLNSGFRRALNDANGAPTVYVDHAGPHTGPATGGIEAPFTALDPALKSVPKGGEINITPGTYSTGDLKIPNRPLRIRAPFGGIRFER